MLRLVVFSITVVALSYAGVCGFAPIRYPAATDTYVNGINNKGAIVGEFTSNGVQAAFVRTSAGMFLSFNYQGQQTVAHAINDSGVIVGFIRQGNPLTAFTRTPDGSYTNIKTDRAFTGINNTGVISGFVGWATGFVGAQEFNIFIPESGPERRLAETFPAGINNLGVVVGNVFPTPISNKSSAFIRDVAGGIQLFQYPAAPITAAASINDSGMIVGEYWDAVGNTHGFIRYESGALETVDYPGASATTLNGVNNAGQIVGTASVAGHTQSFSAQISSSSSQGCLATPTRLDAKQIGNTGMEIELSWEDANESVQGFKVDRKTVSGPWQPVDASPMQTTSGHWSMTDSADTPFATYTYRVRAYRGSVESANSNESTCFQVNVFVLSQPAIQATFTPDLDAGLPSPLDKVAHKLGYDHFNWINWVEYKPPNLVWTGLDGNVYRAPPRFFDPPKGGWNYISHPLPADDLPFYWNETVGFDLNYSLCGEAKICRARDLTSLRFEDIPGDSRLRPNERDQFIAFITELVGVRPNGTSEVLHNFSWYSDRNLKSQTGGVIFRSSNLEVLEGSGGIFNVSRDIRTEDLPMDLRSALIEMGAQNVPNTPKIDRDSPSTAAFIKGTAVSPDLYAGPVVVTLIATDIDGPSDIGFTTYSIDGGPIKTYLGPFVVSGIGSHTITYGSTDRSGNVEKPRPAMSVKVTALESQPEVIDLSPKAGSGPMMTVTAVYRHSAGKDGHYLGYILFLPTPNVVNYVAKGSCLIEYNRISNGMRLIDDAGTGWIGPLEGVPVSPLASPLSNSACTIGVAGSSATFSGNDMTVTVPVTFKAAGLTPVLGTFLQEEDVNGRWTDMRQFGSWMLSDAPARSGPSVVGLSPLEVIGTTATFTATASHSSGTSQIGLFHMLIADRIVGGSACQVVYFAYTNTIALINDEGTGFAGPGEVVLGSANTLANSRCAVNAAAATRSVIGTNLSVTYTMTFTPATFGGLKNVYLNTFDQSGNLSHWVQGGTMTVQ